MIHLHHELGDPELGSTFTQHELRTKDFVVVRSIHDGGRNDDALENAVAPEGSGWSSVRFVLQGPLAIRQGSGGPTLDRGDAFVATHAHTAPGRTLTDRSDVLALAWRRAGEDGAYAGMLSLSPAARGGLVQLANVIASRDTPGAILAAREATFGLRAAGVVLPADGPRTPTTSGALAMARALERVFFPLAARPMAIDLAQALGVGQRHALRLANAYFRDYYAGASTWRDYVHVMRIGLGTFFMSHPRARTEKVSQLLGFGSPTSFCHALQEAGLPSPSAVQRALLAA